MEVGRAAVTSRGGKAPRKRVNRSGPYRSPDSHQAILAATWAILEEVGYHDLTIDGVSARAGVGKATIYRWWASKGGLVADAIASHLNFDPVPQTDNVRADLYATIQVAVENYSGTVAGVAIPALLADLAFDPKGFESFRNSFLEPRRRASAEVVQRAIDEGVLPADTDIPLLLDFVGRGDVLPGSHQPRTDRTGLHRLADVRHLRRHACGEAETTRHAAA
jgi:AcrR family transcriptional regulator